ncbi:2'-5' RNA ligase family protein [Saccharopolyspora erythraea]|uniref:2'-5' RNA ligase family protein n=1 Tax=Saccharopolyspora erythraea TaxID=1836 RepID=UPI001BADEF20|nr:2'-5' RNA ligase family protein [Saccharopolyspora erythraea]QUH00944.1 2'-5' RNA ligase family protein [Saccharopolyspora erythraea]
MRLFTALWPSDEAVRHLSAALDSLPEDRLADATDGLRKFRFIPSARWHLTLCFHGDDADPGRLGERLERKVAAVRERHPAPPRLRLAAGGSFRGVLWVGTEPEDASDAAAIRALVRAAGADPHDYQGHLTVARWAAGRPRGGRLRGLLDDYAGPWWELGEVTLVRSDQGEGGPVYTPVRRVALTRPDAGATGE